jgi:EAL domain-containing protein (putative c-di-GMP-specific phosphodiesterase class I)
MQRVDYAADVLQALREAGVHVAVDDFGTGYSSLSYLTTLAIDTLKVDRSFVHDLTGSARAAAVVVAVMAMARSFSLRVIAEGVETREEAAFLQSHQCDEAQGFYFSGPLPPLEFARLRRGGQPLGGMRPEPAFTLGTQTGRA